MPVRYLIALAGAAVLMAFVFGYHQGAEKVKRDMAIQAAAQAEDARQKEKDMQTRLNGITENYLHEIDEYKKTINAYAANDLDVNRLSGTHDRPCQQCPEIPEINPVLSVTPQPTYREKLRKVWILPQNAMNSQ